MSRFDDASYEMDPRERETAAVIKDLANRLQEILYYCAEVIDLPGETKAILMACYRPLHKATSHYYDDRHSLVYEPPTVGSPFRSRDRR